MSSRSRRRACPAPCGNFHALRPTVQAHDLVGQHHSRDSTSGANRNPAPFRHPNTCPLTGFAGSSYGALQYKTRCNRCNTSRDEAALPAMIAETWPRLTPARRATSFWLTPWASIRSHTASWSNPARWAGHERRPRPRRTSSSAPGTACPISSLPSQSTAIREHQLTLLLGPHILAGALVPELADGVSDSLR